MASRVLDLLDDDLLGLGDVAASATREPPPSVPEENVEDEQEHAVDAAEEAQHQEDSHDASLPTEQTSATESMDVDVPSAEREAVEHNPPADGAEDDGVVE